MKLLLSILVILSVIFLVSCSKVDTGDISKKELESLANKYGGIYIFNKKYYDEINKREKERDKKNREILDRIKPIQDKDERNKKMREILKVEFYNNPKLEQILSNGKKYYFALTNTIPNEYIDKIYKFIGQENINKHRPAIVLRQYYKDNEKIIPIKIEVIYNYSYKSYGLFGDEGAGFRFSETNIASAGSKYNVFYLENLEK